MVNVAWEKPDLTLCYWLKTLIAFAAGYSINRFYGIFDENFTLAKKMLIQWFIGPVFLRPTHWHQLSKPISWQTFYPKVQNPVLHQPPNKPVDFKASEYSLPDLWKFGLCRFVGRSVRSTVRLSVADYSEHAIYGDQPCLLKISKICDVRMSKLGHQTRYQ